MMTRIGYCTASLVGLLLAGCAMGRTASQVTVVDENGKSLNAVIVVPLYSVSSGISIGPDGKRLAGEETNTLLIRSASVFDSGEDLFEKEELSKGVLIPIPPFMFMGTGRSVRSRLFLKRQFVPQAWFVHDNHPRPPVLKNSTGNECEEAIDLLLQPKPDQPALKRLFGVEWLSGDVVVDLDAGARALLQAEK
jgi:hypothetical protein